MRELSKLLLGVVLVGCSSSADEGVEIDAVESLIAFSPMYSAFDGMHEYALTPYIPRADVFSEDEEAILASSVKWELDETFVKREEFPDLLAAIKLTTKKAGATIVAATAKTLSGQTVRGEAKLVISQANESEWDAGEDYYNNAPKKVRSKPTVTEANGEQCPQGLNIELPPSPSACASCHNATSMLSFEQTPTQTAGYSNEELIKIFTEAELPRGEFKGPFLRAAPMPACIYKEIHTWEMSDELKRGIVWKLRSIPPQLPEE